MTALADVLVRLDVLDDDVLVEHLESFVESITSTILERKRHTLSNGFTAITVPTGAKGVIMVPISGAFTHTLKGITGDTGVVLGAASTLPIIPIVLPLGTTPSLGLACTGAAVVLIVFF
jgi:hypothetical protein